MGAGLSLSLSLPLSKTTPPEQQHKDSQILAFLRLFYDVCRNHGTLTAVVPSPLPYNT